MCVKNTRLGLMFLLKFLVINKYWGEGERVECRSSIARTELCPSRCMGVEDRLLLRHKYMIATIPEADIGYSYSAMKNW